MMPGLVMKEGTLPLYVAGMHPANTGSEWKSVIISRCLFNAFYESDPFPVARCLNTIKTSPPVETCFHSMTLVPLIRPFRCIWHSQSYSYI